MATTELCWSALPAWISPGAALFVLFNVLVGAIAVTSRMQVQPGGGTPGSRSRPCRSASSMVLARLRSFSVFSVHPAAAECYYHASMEADEQQLLNGPASQQPLPVQAAAERWLRSAPAEAVAADEAPSMSETPKDALESSEDKPASSDEAHVQDQERQHDAPESLSPPPPASTAADEEATAAMEGPRKKTKQTKAAVQRSKRRTRVSGREAEEEAPEGKAELNARAELFIRQFREDLKLQRLNSIINYTRALGRGSGDAAPEND